MDAEHVAHNNKDAMDDDQIEDDDDGNELFDEKELVIRLKELKKFEVIFFI